MLAVKTYGQNNTTKKFEVYANSFEEFLQLGLNYSSIEKKYLENISDDSLAVKSAKSAEISALKASAFSKAKIARREGLEELNSLIKEKGVVADQEMLSILDKKYQKYIYGLKKDYLQLVKSKAGI